MQRKLLGKKHFIYISLFILIILILDGYFSFIKIPFTNKYLSCRLPNGRISTGFNDQEGVKCCPGLVESMDSMSYDVCYFPNDKRIFKPYAPDGSYYK